MQGLGYIDLYCERMGPEYWAEPLNALSNLSFILAALVAIWVILRRGYTDLAELLVVALAASVGVGSFLFHTHASAGTELADVIPIWSFVALYVLVAIYRATGQSALRTLRIAGIAVAIGGGVFWLTSGDVTTDTDGGVGPLNGSLQYAPALIALVVFAVLSWRRGGAERGYIAAAAAVFALSLVFRTVDLALCQLVPFGTHFMWHLLNGVMMGLILFAMVRFTPPLRR